MTRRQFFQSLGAIPLVGFLLSKYTPLQLEEEVSGIGCFREVSRYCCYTCLYESIIAEDVTNFSPKEFTEYLTPLSTPAIKKEKRVFGDMFYELYYCGKHAPEGAIPL